MNRIVNGINVKYDRSEGINRKKNKWKLTDSMSERIKEMARSDAQKSVYMGEAYHNLVRNEASKVAPNRGAAIAQATRLMNQSAAQRARNAKIVQEAGEKWLCLLMGLPYKAKFEDGPLGTGAHIFDENGDEILTYTPNVGWHQRSTKEEQEVFDTMRATYYEAFHEARKSSVSEENTFGNFDAKA